MSGYRDAKSCEGCGGQLTRPGYDDWGRFVCHSCVAKASVAEGDRRAAESEAGGMNIELSDNPYRAARQVRGILGGIVTLLSIFMCAGMGAFAMGIAFYQDGKTLMGLGVGGLGLLTMATPLLFAAYRVRRAKHAGRDEGPQSYR